MGRFEAGLLRSISELLSFINKNLILLRIKFHLHSSNWMLELIMEGLMDYLNTNDNYDSTDAKSIELYAKKMIGMSFRDILDADFENRIEESTSAHFENKKFKGGLGELVEKHFFHYEPNGDSRPDFYEAGCELKVSPFKKNLNGSFVAKERLVISMINYMKVINETFETSHLWTKASLILLVYYLWDKDSDRLDYIIKYANLFTPSKEDLKIIKNDYYIIQNKIKAGLAHELSGSDTLYLEACTKAANSKVRRPQPNSDIQAKPRAFAFKTSYMTYVLNHYVLGNKSNTESIIQSSTNIPFEDYIKNKIDNYRDYSVEDLCAKFDITIENKKPKNLEAILAYRILGIKGNKASEFVKAGIAVKTIRVGNNNKIREHMSFPTFRFTELIKESWEESTFRDYLNSTRFFFIVYKYDENNILRLKGCQFWSVPYNDLETDIKKVWEQTVNVIRQGIKVKTINGVNYNNLPSPSENRVCHVRPHGRNKNDTYELPNGGSFTKQCFWLNNSYILSQLNEDLLK